MWVNLNEHQLYKTKIVRCFVIYKKLELKYMGIKHMGWQEGKWSLSFLRSFYSLGRGKTTNLFWTLISQGYMLKYSLGKH